MARASVPAHIRIMARVEKRPGPLPTECWIFTGAANNHGYCLISIGSRAEGKSLVHRIIWEWSNKATAGELCVLHKCDTPRCVNPEHLFLGTQKDNSEDCVKKGRHSSTVHKASRPRGAVHHMTTLTEKQVRELRALHKSGCSMDSLAIRYGVCLATISNIVRRRYWKHVPD